MVNYLGKFHHDLTVLLNPGIIVNKGDHPHLWPEFRLVNYYNLPRYMVNLWLIVVNNVRPLRLQSPRLRIRSCWILWIQSYLLKGSGAGV